MSRALLIWLHCNQEQPHGFKENTSSTLKYKLALQGSALFTTSTGGLKCGTEDNLGPE